MKYSELRDFSGFLITGGTSHEGVGMQPSLMSLSRCVLTSLTAFPQSDGGGALRCAGLLPLTASHTTPFVLTCFPTALLVIRDKANESDKELGHQGLGFEIKNLASRTSPVHFIYFMLYIYMLIYVIYISIYAIYIMHMPYIKII